MAENFPNLGKETAFSVQETQSPTEDKPRENTPRHTVIKITIIKDKGRILNAAREKLQITHKESPIRLPADFSAETLQARRDWHNIFKVTKRKNPHSRILLTSKALVKVCQINKKLQRQAKRKKKLSEFSTTKPVLQQMLKNFSIWERKCYN